MLVLLAALTSLDVAIAFVQLTSLKRFGFPRGKILLYVNL